MRGVLRLSTKKPGGSLRAMFRSIKEVLDLFASAGVAELSESLSLDLADTLTGNVELLAYFFEGA